MEKPNGFEPCLGGARLLEKERIRIVRLNRSPWARVVIGLSNEVSEIQALRLLVTAVMEHPYIPAVAQGYEFFKLRGYLTKPHYEAIKKACRLDEKDF